MAEVEVAKLTLRCGNEHAGDLWPPESGLDPFGVVRPDDHRGSLRVRFLQPLHVLAPVEDQGLVERDLVLAFDGDLGHAAPGGAEPPLPHSATDSPGAIAAISESVVTASRNASGVPVRRGNVP